MLITTCSKPEVYTTSKYACQTNITNTHPESVKFSNFLEDKVEEGLPGITMLIETPEGIWTGAAGVADIPNEIPMLPCNVHRVGSATKVFTAAVIFMLEEQGMLQLDDKIELHLGSEIVDKIENGKEATITHLLNHSSGIFEYLDIDYTLTFYNDLTKHWTAMEELEFVYNQDAVFPLGTEVSYSNTNYLLLGLIAEKITGKTGTQLYKEMIFDPLNLEHTYFNQESKIPSNLVRGYYDEFGDGVLKDITDITFANNSMAGGLSSNVEDLNVFLKACMTSGGLFSDSTITKMLTISGLPFSEPDKFNYGSEYKVRKISGIGLCWFETETEYGMAYGHDGGMNGRRARMWYWPDSNKSIIILMNASGEKIKPIQTEIRKNDMVKLLFE